LSREGANNYSTEWVEGKIERRAAIEFDRRALPA